MAQRIDHFYLVLFAEGAGVLFFTCFCTGRFLCDDPRAPIMLASLIGMRQGVETARSHIGVDRVRSTLRISVDQVSPLIDDQIGSGKACKVERVDVAVVSIARQVLIGILRADDQFVRGIGIHGVRGVHEAHLGHGASLWSKPLRRVADGVFPGVSFLCRKGLGDRDGSLRCDPRFTVHSQQFGRIGNAALDQAALLIADDIAAELPIQEGVVWDVGCREGLATADADDFRIPFIASDDVAKLVYIRHVDDIRIAERDISGHDDDRIVSVHSCPNVFLGRPNRTGIAACIGNIPAVEYRTHLTGILRGVGDRLPELIGTGEEHLSGCVAENDHSGRIAALLLSIIGRDGPVPGQDEREIPLGGKDVAGFVYPVQKLSGIILVRDEHGLASIVGIRGPVALDGAIVQLEERSIYRQGALKRRVHLIECHQVSVPRYGKGIALVAAELRPKAGIRLVVPTHKTESSARVGNNGDAVAVAVFTAAG